MFLEIIPISMPDEWLGTLEPYNKDDL